MKIYREGNLSSFGFWSGAIPNAKEFTLEELDQITAELETLDDVQNQNLLAWFGYEETLRKVASVFDEFEEYI